MNERIADRVFSTYGLGFGLDSYGDQVKEKRVKKEAWAYSTTGGIKNRLIKGRETRYDEQGSSRSKRNASVEDTVVEGFPQLSFVDDSAELD